MGTLAILPVKSFAGAKQRLAEVLEAGPRRVLAEAMFSDVLVALRRSREVERVVVVSADHGAQRIAGGYGAEVLDDDDRGHNAAALRGLARARELGAERALLVPGDCPLLDPTQLDELLDRPLLAVPSVLIVPDRHGTGTNALVLTPPQALEPSFGEGSCARHVELAQGAGVGAEVVAMSSLAADVDTSEDLGHLQALLGSTHGGAAQTRGMLNQLLRARG